MLFNSLQFGFFFIIIVFAFFLLPHRYRWILLLIGSYYFYLCWNWRYIFLILFSTLIDYFASLRMARLEEKSKRRKYLLLSLISNLGLLFIFKYFNFFSESVNEFLLYLNLPYAIPHLNVLLPVGISFYTFQALSYTIDVYRNRIPAERHLGIFSLYIMFFPQLVAGPIERATRLLPQFYEEKHFDEARIISGLRWMLWGMFKKIVIANRLAIYVDAIYSNAEQHTGLTLLIATYLFAFQIYCDFSGYSDIAIGAARVLGFDLMKNFNRPYFSKTIPEFWSRWHISLSTWFRDYLYIPLGGNRKGEKRMLLNLFIVFFISGVWHGANWTFLIWGGLHAVYAVTSKITLPWRDRWVQKMHIPQPLINGWRIFVTFQLVCLSWIYFRANSLQSANFILKQIITKPWGELFIPALDQFMYGLIAVVILLIVDSSYEFFRLPQRFYRQPRYLRWAAYSVVIIIMVLIGVFNESQFIYFQF
ncbi:MAG: MBOAT family protein [Calditrichaeota bacterium]|nr:MAG: MBOAT family protein [Calditrichota bacterium]